ncbi:hypothetical protein H2O64_20650 [Kordia sp. YSTF-M3]|uniref:Bacteriocin n=1 Tax=Kordia aestuariivivens TaxID=2759037 RepID=A0ABR7QEU3_9FLAO|nr:hypothetical protein [Kordia aestuariivivens]MBC8757095.1 hypothetical protein [Kordia aestuariivivens]
MKKQHLQSLKLNKKTISKANIVAVKGGGHTQLATNCVTACISCQDPR